MTVYAWRCNGCFTVALLKEADHRQAMTDGKTDTCGIMLRCSTGARPCNGIWKPFAQWAAEAIK